ncbi:cysteine desulfurase family protein [Actinosynnema sp. CA-248983]
MTTPDADAAHVVYLDYNATAPLRPEALEAMLPHLRGVGNASSPHALGRQASTGVDAGRRAVAELLGCAPGELIFTSGATEANNLALRAGLGLGGGVVTTAVEHPAVLHAARVLTTQAARSLHVLDVDHNGLFDLEELRRVLSSGQTSLVSVMAANNETGVLTDLAAVTAICRDFGALLHTDATQLVGRLPIDLAELDVDLLSLSAHKFGGPQGVGVLFIRRSARLPHEPLLHGGGQERGWRAGTLNVAGIVGAGAAASAAARSLREEAERTRTLRDHLEAQLLSRIEGARLNGHPVYRLPGVTNLLFPGALADAVLAAMPLVAASDGSACSSGAPTPSHVLMAMGRSREEANCSLRFSLGYATSAADIDQAIDAVIDAVARVRSSLAVGIGAPSNSFPSNQTSPAAS